MSHSYLKPSLAVYCLPNQNQAPFNDLLALTNLECFFLSYFTSPPGLQSHWLSIRSRFFSPQGLCTCNSFCLGPYFCRSFELGLSHLSTLSLNLTSSEGVSLCTYLGRVILYQYSCLFPPLAPITAWNDFISLHTCLLFTSCMDCKLLEGKMLFSFFTTGFEL